LRGTARGAVAVLGAAWWFASASLAPAANFWITNSPASAGSGPAVSAQTLLVTGPLDAAGAFYIWARPDAGQTFAQISLDARSTDANVIDFTGVTVHNPSFGVDGQSGKNRQRYEFTQDSSSATPILPEVDPDALKRFQGFTFTESLALGIGLGADSIALNDPFYDEVANAFLIATVAFEAVNPGATEVFLQIGANGINYDGQTSSQTNVVFGAATDAPLNALTQRGQDSATAELVLQITNLPGDFNADLAVDAADLEIWQTHLGLTSGAAFADGDASGDGSVDGADFLIWQRNFGRATPTSAVAMAAIPEPSAALLAAAAASLFAARRRATRR
jgi:hypothetical protein